MLDLLKSLWDRAVSEGGVVSSAPFLFSGAVLFLTVLVGLGIWQLMDWRYSGIIANRDSTVAARDSHIGLQDAQIKDLEKRISEIKDAAPSVVQDPDVIYQLGSPVGKGIGSQPNLGTGKYYFRAINGGEDFNKDAEFIYRKLVLKIQNFSARTATRMSGEGRSQLVDVVCQVVGRE